MPISLPSALTPPNDLALVAERMRLVTGFISILTDPGDQRAQVFARYYHVRRVAWMARHLATNGCGGESGGKDIDWYSWAHDLNRWPFAHNSERGLFDQAKDIPRYLRDECLIATADRVCQVQSIIDKRPSSLGPEASTVLLADIVTGFIEDPLWLLTALNLSPQVIPQFVAEYLCVPLGTPSFIDEAFHLLQTFRPDVEVDEFVAHFDAIFVRIALDYVSLRILSYPDSRSKSVLLSDDFSGKRKWIKDYFLRQVIFPYNNQKISHGPMIKSSLIEPLLPHLGDNHSRNMHLTRSTDESLVGQAINLSILTADDRVHILPDLDYMDRKEPRISFRYFMEARKCP